MAGPHGNPSDSRAALESLPLPLLFAGLFVLLILSAFFSGSETALMAINRYRLRHQAKRGLRGARLVQALIERPDRFIGLVLLGNNFVNILASAITTLIFIRLAGDAGVLAGTLFLTVTILIFAEVAPKTLAAQYPERVAYPAAYVLYPLLRVLSPLVRLINALAGLVTRPLRRSSGSARSDHLSAEELRTLLGESAVLVPPRHRRMLLNILDLEEATVADVMVPRNEIVGIDLDDPLPRILEQLSRFPYSRVPLYHGSIDQVVGILHPRALLASLAEGGVTVERLVQAARKPYFVPESTPLMRQLGEFQKRGRRMALVVDEYGDIVGLVTIEDILEEIVGEFTSEPLENSRRIERLPDASVRIDGRIGLRQLNRMMGWELPTDGARTLSGLIVDQLESLPAPGATVRVGGLTLRIDRVEDNVVRQVTVLPAEKAESDDAGA